MKAKMSWDGIQKVDVPINQAIDIAINKNDDYNLRMINEIKRMIIRKGKITKSDFDYIKDYIRNNS